MNDRGFVAPMQKFAHGTAVRPSDHEALHGGFGNPKRRRPESVTPIAQQLDSEIPFRSRSLSRGANRVNCKHWHKAPGANAQPSDRNEGHGLV
jgi:hypothetical protein